MSLIEAIVAERAPTLALPRKRVRERIEFAVSTVFRAMENNIPSARQVKPPLPLAGEGWGGGLSTSEASMVDPEQPTWNVSKKLRANARELRKNSTDAERILWSELRDHRLNGIGFRRQVPIKNYIADFACHAAKLVVELDGGQHFSDKGERADAARSAVIEARGFKILRFSNHDVMTNRVGVLETLTTAIAERAPTPTLPRKRERERTIRVEKKQS